jgi:hypothetical protein
MSPKRDCWRDCHDLAHEVSHKTVVKASICWKSAVGMTVPGMIEA